MINLPQFQAKLTARQQQILDLIQRAIARTDRKRRHHPHRRTQRRHRAGERYIARHTLAQRSASLHQ